MKGVTNREVRKLLTQARDAGCRIVHSKRTSHWKVFSPTGQLLTSMSHTPSDSRGVNNSRAQLKRAGIVL